MATMTMRAMWADSAKGACLVLNTVSSGEDHPGLYEGTAAHKPAVITKLYHILEIIGNIVTSMERIKCPQKHTALPLFWMAGGVYDSLNFEQV